MVIPREICTFTTSYFSISIPFEKKRSISCGNGVVESKVNARAEETHTMVRAILSLRGNDNTWLHTLLHADTSVPLLLWENTDILSSGCAWTNSECKNVLKERQTYRERMYARKKPSLVWAKDRYLWRRCRHRIDLSKHETLPRIWSFRLRGVGNLHYIHTVIRG